MLDAKLAANDVPPFDIFFLLTFTLALHCAKIPKAT